MCVSGAIVSEAENTGKPAETRSKKFMHQKARHSRHSTRLVAVLPESNSHRTEKNSVKFNDDTVWFRSFGFLARCGADILGKTG